MTRARRNRRRTPRFRPLLAGVATAFAVLLVAACPGPDASETASGDAAGDTVTQRERYEALEDARVPGAGGLTGALDASDAAAAAAAARDSILRGQ